MLCGVMLRWFCADRTALALLERPHEQHDTTQPLRCCWLLLCGFVFSQRKYTYSDDAHARTTHAHDALKRCALVASTRERDRKTCAHVAHVSDRCWWWWFFRAHGTCAIVCTHFNCAEVRLRCACIACIVLQSVAVYPNSPAQRRRMNELKLNKC